MERNGDVQKKLLMWIVGLIGVGLAGATGTLMHDIRGQIKEAREAAQAVAEELRDMNQSAARVHAAQAERLARLEVVIPEIHRDVNRIEKGQASLGEKMDRVLERVR